VDGRLRDVFRAGSSCSPRRSYRRRAALLRSGRVTPGEALRAAAEYLERKGRLAPARRGELPACTRSGCAGRAVHAARPAADRGRARGGACVLDRRGLPRSPRHVLGGGGPGGYAAHGRARAQPRPETRWSSSARSRHQAAAPRVDVGTGRGRRARDRGRAARCPRGRDGRLAGCAALARENADVCVSIELRQASLLGGIAGPIDPWSDPPYVLASEVEACSRCPRSGAAGRDDQRTADWAPRPRGRRGASRPAARSCWRCTRAAFQVAAARVGRLCGGHERPRPDGSRQGGGGAMAADGVAAPRRGAGAAAGRRW
jgi:hypothetical protein